MAALGKKSEMSITFWVYYQLIWERGDGTIIGTCATFYTSVNLKAKRWGDYWYMYPFFYWMDVINGVR